MGILYQISPATALVRGLDRFGIVLTNWGNQGATADPNNESIITPAQNFSIAGISIAPTGWTSLAGSVNVSSSNGYGSSQQLSHETPFIADIPGPWQMVASSDDRYFDSYLPSGATAPSVFGPTMGNDPTGSPIFPDHRLYLTAYLRPPLNVPTKRASMYDDVSNRIIPVGTTTQRVYGIAGRRSARVVVKSGAAVGSFDVWLEGSVGGPVPFITAFPLAVAVTLTAGEEAVFNLTSLNSSWLFLNVKLNAGAPTAWWNIVASDD